MLIFNSSTQQLPLAAARRLLLRGRRSGWSGRANPSV